eukprot:superscaffoldBa00005436_g20342
MAASLLRIGRLGCVKCLQAESWITLSRAPAAAAYSTKSGGSKKSSKKNSLVICVRKKPARIQYRTKL